MNIPSLGKRGESLLLQAGVSSTVIKLIFPSSISEFRLNMAYDKKKLLISLLGKLINNLFIIFGQQIIKIIRMLT